MSIFEKVKAERGNRSAKELLLSDEFEGRSVAHSGTVKKPSVLEYMDAIIDTKYELLLETDTKLVCKGIDETSDGRYPVIDVWTHDGKQRTACDFVFGAMEEK